MDRTLSLRAYGTSRVTGVISFAGSGGRSEAIVPNC